MEEEGMYQQWQLEVETLRVHFGYQGGNRRLESCPKTLTLGIPTLGHVEAPNFEVLYQKLKHINKSMEWS